VHSGNSHGLGLRSQSMSPLPGVCFRGTRPGSFRCRQPVDKKLVKNKERPVRRFFAWWPWKASPRRTFWFIFKIARRRGCRTHPCFKMPDSGSPENHQIAFNEKFHLSGVVQTWWISNKYKEYILILYLEGTSWATFLISKSNFIHSCITAWEAEGLEYFVYVSATFTPLF
jgi:hypothetical protein